MLTITKDAWAKFAPKCPANYTAALFDNLHLLEEAGILDNERRWCHWAATVHHETGAFRDIRENLSYTTTKALRKAWPSRFGHKSDAELKPLLRNPVGLADTVYGCYSGRPKSVIGDVGPGEAHAWRGGGWFNTTFKPAVEGYCQKLGLDKAPPEALDDPVLTLRMAVFEWTETGCNKWADENNIRAVAKAINTGSATSGIEPVGMDGRKESFARAWKQWGEAGKAEEPARPMGFKDAVAKVAVPVTAAGEFIRQTIATSPDPAPKIAVAKKGIETGAEVKGVGIGIAELLSWAMANPAPLALACTAILAVWVGPALWRRFT